ncbi:MAG: hypothetical protein ACOVQA_04640 [Thermoflexibacteraceae bacterium]|jgi:hypothetical protein
MLIQRQENNLVISINTSNVDMKILEGLIQYLRVMELLSQNKGTEPQAMELAEDLKNSWWENNKKQFLQ